MFVFFNDTATTEIYTLSLHDALPISHSVERGIYGIVRVEKEINHIFLVCDGLLEGFALRVAALAVLVHVDSGDRKSTRLNSSHANISYAVFCLKKKQIHNTLLCNNNT